MNPDLVAYKVLIDPLLSGLRKGVKAHVEAGSTFLDIACGTGSMAFQLKAHCTQITGIDLDEPKIHSAQRSVEMKGLDHMHFKILDATRMPDFKDRQFTYAHMSMAIHQFAPDIRKEIITEAMRVSEHLIIADYACPMPKNPAGWLSKFIERLAGEEHHSNFLDYQRTGGIPGLLNSMGIPVKEVDTRAYGAFKIYLLRSTSTG